MDKSSAQHEIIAILKILYYSFVLAFTTLYHVMGYS